MADIRSGLGGRGREKRGTLGFSLNISRRNGAGRFIAGVKKIFTAAETAIQMAKRSFRRDILVKRVKRFSQRGS